jgi:hypothetical protein
MACYGIPKPADATPVNIIWPAFDELLEDQRQAFDDMFALDDICDELDDICEVDLNGYVIYCILDDTPGVAAEIF